MNWWIWLQELWVQDWHSDTTYSTAHHNEISLYITILYFILPTINFAIQDIIILTYFQHVNNAYKKKSFFIIYSLNLRYECSRASMLENSTTLLEAWSVIKYNQYIWPLYVSNYKYKIFTKIGINKSELFFLFFV